MTTPRSRRWMVPLAGWVPLACLLPFALHAQSAPPEEAERRWEVVTSLGGTLGGPAGELENAIRDVGWVNAIEGLQYPLSTGTELTWTATIRRSVRPHLDIGVIAGGARTGSTSGSREFLHHLRLSHSTLTVASVLSYGLGALHAGAGPAVTRIRVEADHPEGNTGRTQAWKVGLLVETGVAYPRTSRLFFDARGQYRWIPRHTVGPYAGNAILPGLDPGILPAVEIDSSHGFLSLGLGARF